MYKHNFIIFPVWIYAICRFHAFILYFHYASTKSPNKSVLKFMQCGKMPQLKRTKCELLDYKPSLILKQSKHMQSYDLHLRSGKWRKFSLSFMRQYNPTTNTQNVCVLHLSRNRSRKLSSMFFLS